MEYEELKKIIEKNPIKKTKDLDIINKRLIKEKQDVSSLKNVILKDQLFYRTYFQVSLGEMNSYQEQFEFIENNSDLLQDWWHVDILIQFVYKPIEFSFAFQKAKKYVIAKNPYLRRWGYVLFLANLQKDSNTCNQILSLMKDDEEYYVQMGEAWLLADLAIYSFDQVYEFLIQTKMRYNIIGKAIQKMIDSFRISDDNKKKLKELRPLKKNN